MVFGLLGRSEKAELNSGSELGPSLTMSVVDASNNHSLQKPLLVSWSGGKDSCFALHEIRKISTFQVKALLTTITSDYDRISMHGVRRILLEQQASSLGLELRQILISKDAGNEEYESNLSKALMDYRESGVNLVAFGDLFLEDVRAYRERLLAKNDMEGVFPLWRRDTSDLIREFIDLGYQSIVTCVNAKLLDESFAGRIIDYSFLQSLPTNVDPCGENGEYHSFVFDGPIFRQPVRFSGGARVLRDSFWFFDLVPEQ
jgi:uncharacterized protein (TIGR00290 family)